MSLGKLGALFIDLAASLRREPRSFRLFWPTEYGVITQHYGMNKDYYHQFGLDGHEGIDFRAPHGSNIFACAAGTVYRVEATPVGNYGCQVRIDHHNGYKTIYAHLLRPTVSAGDTVRMGQVIGLADNTGNSRGDHLHLTVKYGGQIIDPTWLLLLKQARPQGGHLDENGQFFGKDACPMGSAATGRASGLRGARYCSGIRYPPYPVPGAQTQP